MRRMWHGRRPRWRSWSKRRRLHRLVPHAWWSVPTVPWCRCGAGNGVKCARWPSGSCHRQKRQPSGAALRRTEEITYFSRFTTAETFIRQALVETHRRGLENAGEVAAVLDGADWLQGLADHHCPRALRILDFPHAAQRIAAIGQTLWPANSTQANSSQANSSQANSSQAAAWITQWTRRLKHEGPQPLLAELRQLQAQYPDCEPLRSNYAYLAKREAQLQYPEFSQQDWPIGSGMVESANKSVVEARLKGAGMHWQRTHVDPMLALRNLVCNDRWQQEWPQIHAQLLAQAKAQRMQPCRQRLHEHRMPPARSNARRPANRSNCLTTSLRSAIFIDPRTQPTGRRWVVCDLDALTTQFPCIAYTQVAQAGSPELLGCCFVGFSLARS